MAKMLQQALCEFDFLKYSKDFVLTRMLLLRQYPLFFYSGRALPLDPYQKLCVCFKTLIIHRHMIQFKL